MGWMDGWMDGGKCGAEKCLVTQSRTKGWAGGRDTLGHRDRRFARADLAELSTEKKDKETRAKVEQPVEWDGQENERADPLF